MVFSFSNMLAKSSAVCITNCQSSSRIQHGVFCCHFPALFNTTAFCHHASCSHIPVLFPPSALCFHLLLLSPPPSCTSNSKATVICFHLSLSSLIANCCHGYHPTDWLHALPCMHCLFVCMLLNPSLSLCPACCSLMLCGIRIFI